jgi:hypothetical protein
MKLIWLFLKVAIPTLALVVGGARLLGSTQKNVAFATLFTLPGGEPCQRPCVFGVRPGVTTYEEAVALFRQHPVLHGAQVNEVERDDNFGNPGGVVSNEEMRIGFSAGDDGTIRYVIIDVQLPPKNRPDQWTAVRFDRTTLADIVAVLGTPERVLLTRRRFNFATYYVNEGIGLTLQSRSTRRFSWKDRAVVFYIQSAPLQLNPDMLAWRGFVPTQRYDRVVGAGVTLTGR